MDFIHNVPIKVPNKSGFDLSHEHVMTGVCGKLAPALVYELLPNETISLGASFQIQLPPAVTDFYGRVDYHLEAFFVPNRLCWAGWKDFITHPTFAPQYPEGTKLPAKPKNLPSFRIGLRASQDYEVDVRSSAVSWFDTVFGPGTLCDYLGYKLKFSSGVFDDAPLLSGSIISTISESESAFVFNNLLPFIAYGRIFDDWYRDSRIQAPLFAPAASYVAGPPVSNSDEVLFDYSPATMPFMSGVQRGSNTAYQPAFLDSSLFAYFQRLSTLNESTLENRSSFNYADGFPFYELRSRNWKKDMFTSANTYPQASIVGGRVELPVQDGQTSLSIAALRSANSLQQWSERNGLAGFRYSDQIYAQFGRYPADAIMDRPIYLGRIKQSIYNRSVFQTAPSDIQSTNNPFNSVGSRYASPNAVGDGSLISSFTASEHGFLFVIASLVPHAYYGSGVSRMLKRSVVGDFAFPLLANMGDQAIRVSELSNDPRYLSNDIDFGYTDLYAEYKVINDHVSGHMRDGYNLSNFALQRSFSDAPELGSDFLTIPPEYLDQVLTVSVDQSKTSYWADIYFTFKKSSPLPVYSQPTLMDLQNGHIETISRGGTRL